MTSQFTKILPPQVVKIFIEIVLNAVSKARSELTSDQQSRVDEFLSGFDASEVLLWPQFVYPEMLAHGGTAEVLCSKDEYKLLCDVRLATNIESLSKYVLPYAACLAALDAMGRHCGINTLVIGESYPIPGLSEGLLTRIVDTCVPAFERRY